MTRTPASSRPSVPSGGPATINGVLYQVLWSLLQASRLHIEGLRLDSSNNPTEVRLILEPRSGGGDVVVAYGDRRRVEQVKSRSSDSPWSLREVIKAVLPDLYLAAGDAPADSEYYFVTEGRMGEWADVYAFFRSLAARDCPPEPLSALDDMRELRFRRQSTASDNPFWDEQPYTQRRLFERIVDELRGRRAIADRESHTQTQQRLWTVLGRFAFVGERCARQIQDEIDSYLLAVVDRAEDIPTIRNSLALDLARLSTQGSEVIDASVFFAEHGLSAVPLTEWTHLRLSAKAHVDQFVELRGYDEAQDVRGERATTLLSEWNAGTPMLALHGESGQGKSWQAYALARRASGRPGIAAILEGTGEGARTINAAANVVWQDVTRHDGTIPLRGVSGRVRAVIPSRPATWLTLIVDGVKSMEEASHLAVQPWDDWGIRVVLTCSETLANEVQRVSRGRCMVRRVTDFSTSELHRYLATCLGDSWPELPDYLTSALKRPLLAAMYRELAQGEVWRPESEYELFDAYWQRLTAQDALDTRRILRLTAKALGSDEYPWSDHVLVEFDIDGSAVSRLERLGWLRRVTAGSHICFEIPHDRLFNWAVARVLVDSLLRGETTDDQLGSLLATYFNGSRAVGGRQVGYVPLDVVWLLMQESGRDDSILAVLAALESDRRNADSLYTDLIPTVGSPIVEVLLRRLHTVSANAHLTRLISTSLSAIDDDRIPSRAVTLLRDDDALLRRAGALVLSRRPTATALDALWALYCASHRDATPFLRARERERDAQEDFRAALQACAQLDPAWIESAVIRSDPENDPVHALAYLLAAIDVDRGRGAWARCKQTLFQKVDPNKARCLATCVNRYFDTDEVPWLLDHVRHARDGIGAMALRALTRIAPRAALEHLDAFPHQYLGFFGSWYANHLFARYEDETQRRLLEIMRSSDDVWATADIYRGRQHHFDVATVRLLVEELQRTLTAIVTEGRWDDSERLRRELQLLGGINTKPLLDALAGFRGTDFERHLCTLALRIGAQRGRARDSRVREEVMGLLYRIGGDGYSEVINEYLVADSQFARLDAIRNAAKRPNRVTVERLVAIARSDDLWNGWPREQNQAVRALAELGEWEPVLEFLEKWDPNMISSKLVELPDAGLRPPSALLAQARQRATGDDGQSVSPGTAYALGFGTSEDIPRVRALFARATPGTELTHACMTALSTLRDASEETVPFLERELAIPSHERTAKNALIVNGSTAAMAVLQARTREPFDEVVAINLINRTRNASEVTRAQSHFSQGMRFGPVGDWCRHLAAFLQAMDDPDSAHTILEDGAIREGVRTAAFESDARFLVSGSKSEAIKTLARFDKPAAFLAASAALRRPDSRERIRYPRLLAEIDPSAAVPLLLDHLVVEEAPPVMRAIGRALAETPCEREIVDRLESNGMERRRTACFAAGYAGADAVVSVLRRCLDDEDDGVAQRAVESLERRRRRDDTRLLEAAIVDAPSPSDRWLFLDCLILTADPGDADDAWPVDVRALDSLSPSQIEHVNERVERLRRDARRS